LLKTSSLKNVHLVFKIELEYKKVRPFLETTHKNHGDSNSRWYLRGVNYENESPKSYLGLRDLLGVGF